MDQETLLRNHALYQKSRPEWSCDHSSQSTEDTAALDQSEATTHAKSVKGSSSQKRHSLTKGTSPLRRARTAGGMLKTEVKAAMPMVHVSIDPLTSRATKRSNRSRPWNEQAPTVSARSEDFEIVYESYLPKGRWAEYRARQYVTNPRYGQLYELRKHKPRPPPRPPTVTWLWEEEFRLWRFEIESGAGRPVERGRGGVSEVTRQFVDGSSSKQALSARPHAQLFAAYHHQKLTNQRRNLAAIAIQKRVRGWLVRQCISKMKRKALLELGRAWPKVTSEYRDLLRRVQLRHGVKKPSCRFTLAEMGEYLDRRQKYERVFERVSLGDKLSRDQLSDFMQECDHYPTEGEVTTAFNSVFIGAASTAEVIFVLDCSTSVGEMNFDLQLTFVKDVVRGLQVAPDRVRVGVVAFNTDVYHTFGLATHTSVHDVIRAVDEISFKPGLTRTHVALAVTREMFKVSRPGVQKVAVVVTDGQSSDGGRTALEARKAAGDNITVFAVGVGHSVEKQELEDIAGDASRVMMCSSYRHLVDIKHLVSSKLCLRACTLCQHILPRVQRQGLYKAEVLEILYTWFVPPAAAAAAAREGSPQEDPGGPPVSGWRPVSASQASLVPEAGGPTDLNTPTPPVSRHGRELGEDREQPEKVGLQPGPRHPDTDTDTGDLKAQAGDPDTDGQLKPQAADGLRSGSQRRAPDPDRHAAGDLRKEGGHLQQNVTVTNSTASVTAGLRDLPVNTDNDPPLSQLTRTTTTTTTTTSTTNGSDNQNTVTSLSNNDEINPNDDVMSLDLENSDVSNKTTDARPWSSGRGSVQDVCRPLVKKEALELVWTVYPPSGAALPPRASRWLRPLVDGQEAWALMDENILQATDMKVCLGLVVKARLERDGVIVIPSDVRSGVEEVTTYDEAMQKIEKYLAERQTQKGQ